jgi:hypothetical protein
VKIPSVGCRRNNRTVPATAVGSAYGQMAATRYVDSPTSTWNNRYATTSETARVPTTTVAANPTDTRKLAWYSGEVSSVV